MSAKLKLGDRVEVIDEKLEGKIIKIKGNHITFISQEGFSYTYPAHRLIKKENFLSPSFLPGKYVTFQKEESQKHHNPPPHKKNPIPEIDLHANKIPGLPTLIPPSEILTYQLKHLQYFLDIARKKQIRKFIIIHGEGSGKLKKKALALVHKAGFITYDASYLHYGKGAFIAEKK